MLSDYGNILGNSSLRAQVEAELVKNLISCCTQSWTQLPESPSCFPAREFHWHRDPSLATLKLEFLTQNHRDAKGWFGTAELKTPDAIRVVNHKWRCSGGTFFKVCGEECQQQTHIVFLVFISAVFSVCHGTFYLK